ncbi:tRNA modification GTPase MnmE [Candidatus Termititenax dinenymphae]|uniref:tRNA modification GTPase MnmE n=1 Tax=Candidatus Termititenax dinenymphae TaxID=2218523 RepID=A0A388TMC6_9BACT|nr:tRNA modification GTPase MnmE [Candidatus Termititenax dinenymphae]
MNNTIAAIATPPGTGGVAIVRISGTDALSVAQKVSNLKDFQANTVKPCVFYAADGKTVLDRGLLSVFRAPHSYTGEDVAELNCHGSYFLAQKLLTVVLQAGARLAEPGEFTKRAFLAGKLDLTQVEAVADMISAGSDLSLKMALQHLEGDVCREIRSLRNDFLQILSGIEAALDYPEEISDPQISEIQKKLESSSTQITTLLADSDKGLLMKTGATVVLVGKPNAGKSSLFNALLKYNKAIVSDLPGTTRDALEAEISLGGLKINLIDTAGLRETQDVLEKLGTERSQAHLQSADLVLAIFDAASGVTEEDQKILTLLQNRPHLCVINKIDLSEKMELANSIQISAKTGQNLDILIERVLETLNLRHIDINKTVYVSSLRQKNKLIQAARSIEKCLSALKSVDFLDVLAPFLKEVIVTLGEITGDETSAEIIDNIFSTFCVGK